MAEKIARKLVLQSGQVFYGEGFGARDEALCELVFNTSMVGYQEIVSDPAYVGQGVVMTYPLIGNYGMVDDDSDSRRARVGALVVRDYNPMPSNFRYARTLGEILEESGIPGISGIDTRQLVRILREGGPQAGLITGADTSEADCAARLAAFTPPGDLVARVSCKRLWYARTANPRLNVLAVDCGIKGDMIRQLTSRRTNVTIAPHTITAAEVLAQRPDGLFISNGPGRGEDVPQRAQLVGALRGKMPIFGVCLGSQIIALSYGAKLSKMHTGHRGGNHPVEALATGLVEITNQAHGHAIDRDSLRGTGLVETHRSLLDGTVEGICCQADGAYGVLYHPDGALGPQGTPSFYDEFVRLMLERKTAKEGSRHA